METYIENLPNAGKLVSSLRDTGYNSYTAILDIIDNSIDARADKIDLEITKKSNKFTISIADNGIGMQKETLDQALRLGSETEKSEISDLGKYGMGLCTASISMGRKLEVVTKYEDDVMYYSNQDIDHIIKKNKFEKELRVANDGEKMVFNSIINSEHGTLVSISNIDNISNSDLNQFSNTLSKRVGESFRKFIDAGIVIIINGKKVDIIDPLMSSVEETDIYSDEEYIIRLNGIEEKIGVKIALLPKYSKEKNTDLKINMNNQGFYVMRNNRQIANGVTLGIFQKHNSLNRVRLELSFTASLDKQFGVRFSKDGVNVDQSITDFLKNNILSQITSLKNRIEKSTKNNDPEYKVDHSETEDNIARKSKLLIIPDVKVEKRNKKTEKGQTSMISDKTDKKRLNPSKSRLSTAIGAKFSQANMGRTGALYECELIGKEIHIIWNVDHAFYERVILQNKDDKNIVTGIDYLIFSLASAELKISNDENIEMIDNIKTIMSSNLRSLLS